MIQVKFFAIKRQKKGARTVKIFCYAIFSDMMRNMPQCKLAGGADAGRIRGMIRFTLFGVPTHIHASFWVAALLWGFALTAGEPHPLGVLFFALATFVCLLAHEMGHAIAAHVMGCRQMGICLSWAGGCSCSEAEGAPLTRKVGLIMTLAGPMGGLVITLSIYLGAVFITRSAGAAAELCWRMLQGQVPMEYAHVCPSLLLLLVVYMFQISVFWNLINLVPIYPLDGGTVMHELMETGYKAHSISLVAAMLLSMLFFAAGLWALAVLMIALGYYNYRCIVVHTE